MNIDILEVINDVRLLRPAFKDLSTWRAWTIYLKALFGLPIDGGDFMLFSDCTGLDAPPGERVRESFVIAGRRSGKSFISAVIAVYLACFKDWTGYLSVGERGYIFIIAVDKMQAAIIMRYVSGLLEGCPMLRRMIAKEKAEEIELKNRVTITVKTCSFRSVRGYTLLAAILEEIAFWRSEESANPDREVLAAVRPALATIPDSLLIGISTPYSQAGILWDAFRAHYGKARGPLVWKAGSLTMNPTLSRGLIEEALKDDYAAGKAEWLAEFREDLQTFLTSEMIEAAIMPERWELPKIEEAEAHYRAFADPSGGRADSFTLAIAHKDADTGKVVLDRLEEKRPPFSPVDVVKEYSEILKEYNIAEVQGDKYAGEWVVQAFEEQGIGYISSELNKSEIYLNFEPLMAQGTVELLDNKRLRNQLRSLERRTRSGGKDLVDHPKGLNDDLANSCAGACVLAAKDEHQDMEILWL